MFCKRLSTINTLKSEDLHTHLDSRLLKKQTNKNTLTTMVLNSCTASLKLKMNSRAVH